MHNSQLIEEVKRFREKFGTSQTHLARLVGISPQAWSKKEEGKSPFFGHQLAVIARHYGTSMAEAFPSYEPTEGEKALAAELGKVAA